MPCMAHGKHQTPAGKVPLDFLLYMREIKNRDFAKAIGVSDQKVSLYRKGFRPTPEISKRIAKELDVTEAELGWEPARV
jgi:transcriptional regulator with XRE-family HTH domain